MGCAIVLYDGEDFDLEIQLNIIKNYRVTAFCAPTMIYRLMAQADLAGADFGSLRHCSDADEPFNSEAMSAWKNATSCAVYDGYCQTEPINLMANFSAIEIRSGSMGKSFPGLIVDNIDDDGTVLEDDEIDHICVKITDLYLLDLFTDYYKDGAKKAQIFRNG
ncbi:MAG: AMP-binding protein [Paracoccaceae bacterium]|nr:AMP-binding protein [Paracoccaceae bacterium]